MVIRVINRVKIKTNLNDRIYFGNSKKWRGQCQVDMIQNSNQF